jgi:oxygen-independent coproporphyrinogen-3 oxidase
MPRLYGEIPAPKAKKQEPAPRASTRPILVYVHVPFCRSKCHYCAFHSQAFNQVTFAWYLKTLLAEIALWGHRLQHPRVTTLYFGGGTPSLFPLSALAQVMDALRANFAFEDGLEASIEANPDSACDVSFFRALLSFGFNRLSLGVQSFEDAHLALLGRPHNARQAVETFTLARQAGFGNVSLDLMYGLPGQRTNHWLEQLKSAVRLRPEHLSCYGLTPEPDTRLTRSLELGEFVLPEEREQSRMFVHGAEYLESEGYLHYEISNFARMGFACRHNQGYWQGRDYLGLGPSAVSTIGSRRFTNPRWMDAYDAAVRGNFAGLDFEELDHETRLKELVLLSLRTVEGLDLKAYRKLAGRDLLKSEAALMQTLRQNDLIRVKKGRLSLTKTGMLVSNSIISRLI